MPKARAKIDDRWVDVEIMEDNPPFIADPRVQETAIFLTGIGLGIYKGVKSMANYMPNPVVGQKIKKALPWMAGSVLAFVLAPALGAAKVPAQIAGGISAGKALYEVLRKQKEKTA